MTKRMDLLLNKTPWKIISGFPYPEKFCIYCEQKMSLWRALHILDQEEQFKAVFVCLNQDCGAYDEAAKQAYIIVHYSSNFAYETLERQVTVDPRKIDERLRRD